VHIAGQGRQISSGGTGPATLELRETDFTVAIDGLPMVAAYRDLTTIAVQQGQVLLVLGDGNGDARVMLSGLGDRLGLLLAELRDRRARQVLADRFIELADDEALPLVEFRAEGQHGVAQLAYHAWGAALLPLDERQAWRLLRRSAIERVEADVAGGHVAVIATGPAEGGTATDFELAGLGAHAERHRQRLAGLREAALSDAAMIVGDLIPDAPFGVRRLAGGLLVDGRPVNRDELGEAWLHVERAVLSEPVFADAYRAMAEHGGPSWLAIAPRRPGEREHLAWFFVGLPGDLVALELVSSGAHATYLFRADRASAATVVTQVSEALIDMRFLRQPIYLTDAQLLDPRHLRSRLAIAALPSLRAARSSFVGRLIHRDEEGWRRDLDAAIAWSSSAGLDAGRWPGAAAATDDEDEQAADYRQPTEENS
jgi:hypothetical protein